MKKVLAVLAPMVMAFSVYAAGVFSLPLIHEPKVPSRLQQD